MALRSCANVARRVSRLAPLACTSGARSASAGVVAAGSSLILTTGIGLRSGWARAAGLRGRHGAGGREGRGPPALAGASVQAVDGGGGTAAGPAAVYSAPA